MNHLNPNWNRALFPEESCTLSPPSCKCQTRAAHGPNGILDNFTVPSRLPKACKVITYRHTPHCYEMLPLRRDTGACSLAFKTCLPQQDLREVGEALSVLAMKQWIQKQCSSNAKCHMEEPSPTLTTSQGNGEKIFTQGCRGFCPCVPFAILVLIEIQLKLVGKIFY